MATKKKPASNASTTTAYQKFQVQELDRSVIKEASYNPRVISEEAEKKLNKKMRKVGLLSPLVWNKRTGNLVSGHQRLHQLDALEGYGKGAIGYRLQVAVVDLDEKTEKEMVVFLNNPSVQGEFDFNKIVELKELSAVEFDEMGFSASDIRYYLGDAAEFSELFKDNQDVKDSKEKLKEIADMKKQAREKMKEESGVEFFFVLVFENEEEKIAFANRMGFPVYERYVDPSLFEQYVKREVERRINQAGPAPQTASPAGAHAGSARPSSPQHNPS